MKRLLNSIQPLRITLLAGLILFVLSGIVLTAFYFMDRSASAATRQQDSFNRILREYDEAFDGFYLTEREFDYLNSELDRLEKRAISVESWLSVIKRRRTLASLHAPSNTNYRNTINSALKAYPSSEPIIAIAASALVKNSGINRETERQLREWLPYISDADFNNLRLGLHVILGDFNNPERALSLPVSIFTDGSENITVNLALLKTLRSDYRGANADIQMILSSASPSVNAMRFAAEYHYDFGDLLRSAEIFSYINDVQAIIRQADALYLAGYTDIAEAIWVILADFSNATSLYNLSLITEDPAKAAGYLERLVKIETDHDVIQKSTLAREFGLIRYSRLLDHNSAISLLGSSVNFSPQKYPYVDLEICKRHAQSQHLGRQIAETWLLLDRHEKNEELYEWALWHFFFQRSFDEAKILLDRMDILSLNAQWVDVYRALYLMNDGSLEEAQIILRKYPAESVNWYVNANHGRILETLRSTTRALEQYELASAKVKDPKSAAIIQMRIARCFTALNRPSEARRTLQYALDLDPGNLGARLELDKNSPY